MQTADSQIRRQLRQAESLRNQGTETARALIDLGLNSLDLHRVWAARAPKNVASEKTLLSAGMTEEGRIRHHVHVRGAWRDSITYSAVTGEWTGDDDQRSKARRS